MFGVGELGSLEDYVRLCTDYVRLRTRNPCRWEPGLRPITCGTKHSGFVLGAVVRTITQMDPFPSDSIMNSDELLHRLPMLQNAVLPLFPND